MIHIRSFFCLVVSFGCGIALENFYSLPLTLSSVITTLLFILSMSFVNQRVVSLLLLLIAFLGLGMGYTQAFTTFPKNHFYYSLGDHYRKMIGIEGVITSEVQRREYFRGTKTTFELEVKRIRVHTKWLNKEGRLLVNLYQDSDLRYGDYLSLTGHLHRPYEFFVRKNFSYREYLKRKRIHFILSVGREGTSQVLDQHRANGTIDLAYRLREHLKSIYAKHLTPREASVLQALVVGDQSHIPRTLRDLFVRTGTAHILAVSGFNVGIVAAFIFLFLRLLPVPLQIQYVLTILLIIGYAILTGLQPSIVRAAIMAVIFFLGLLIEKEVDGLHTLSLAAFLLLLYNPMYLFDIGFQLSFMSVLALIVLYPALYHPLTLLPIPFDKHPVRYLIHSLLVSLAAWLGVAALIAFYFEIVTPVTILANLLILPLTTMIVFLGLGLLLIETLFPLLAYPFVICIKVVLNLMVAIVFGLDQLPGSHFYLREISWGFVILYYLVLGIMTGILLKKAEKIRTASVLT